jgi:hypothetical protein
VGQALDVEFNDVKATTDQILANLKLIQRDDGALANGSSRSTRFRRRCSPTDLRPRRHG